MSPLAVAGGLALGVAVGAVSGVIGIGGGALLVPTLVLLFGLSQKSAQGTSLAMLLLPTGFFAFYSYYRAGHVDIRLAALLAIGFAVGGWFGGTAAEHLSESVLRKAFATVMLLLAVKLFVQR